MSNVVVDSFTLFGASSGGVSEPPEGARSRLNFQIGFYYCNGIEQAVTALLGNGPDIGQAGGTFKTSEISDDGMLVSFPNGNRPFAIGDFYTDLAAIVASGGTLVFDLMLVNPGYGTVVGWYDGISDDDSFDWVVLEGSNLGDGYDVYIGAPSDPSIFDLNPGHHKIAFTVNRDIGGGDRQYAISFDGAAATVAVGTYPGADPADPFPTSSLDQITIGHDGDDAVVLDIVYILSITTYDAKPPEDLPALSALV